MLRTRILQLSEDSVHTAYPSKTCSRQIPQIKIPNYAFRNKGNLQFENETINWGLETPSFSDGAVYVDLDNDGDLDYVVNNINDEAFVYENTTNTSSKTGGNFLDIRFNGDKKNLNGLGAIAKIFYDQGKMQVCENAPVRGYLSTVETKVHFGLGAVKILDSVIIIWPEGKKQILFQVAANSILKVDIKNASLPLQYDTGNDCETNLVHRYQQIGGH